MTKQERQEYMRKWREENRELNREYSKKWRLNNPDQCHGYNNDYHIKERFDSLERYNEAILKYEGECAFACGRKADRVHHIDGKAIHNSPQEQVNNELSNLLPLCRNCHMWLHRKKMRSRGKGR